MGDHRAGLGDAAPVLVVEVDAMAVHGARAQQAVAIVDVEVAAMAGEQLGRPLHLVDVLGHVALHEHVGMAARELGAGFQLLHRRGRREARRERVHLAAAPVPARDQLGAVVVARLRGIAQECRAIAVHQHLAGDHPQVPGLAGLEEGIGRLLVHRAVDQRRGGAAGQQLVDEEARHLARMLRILEAPLGREGVGLQPGQQPRRRRRDHVSLRIVDVRVDEAGHDQLVAQRGEVGVGREAPGQRRVGAGGHHPAVLDDQQAVVLEHGGVGVAGRVCAKGQQPGAEGGLGHERNSSIERVRRGIKAARAARRTTRRRSTSPA
ncbi:Uncharacterised protein [Burkholderia gladioli]|nr:Uncharacterised protein [Burkholderia gladioli]